MPNCANTFLQVSTSGFLSFSWYQFYDVHPPQTPQAWKHYLKDAAYAIAPFWANLNTTNANESAIRFDVYRRYGGASERKELFKVDKVFQDSNQTGDGFKSRIAIVASWINTTYGMIGDTYRSKEVMVEFCRKKFYVPIRLGYSCPIYRNNDEF